MSAKAMDAKLCSRCGADFSCGAVRGHCWCFDIAITPESLAFIKQQYADCLCLKCLKMLAEVPGYSFVGPVSHYERRICP